jgi:Domain of unknown function (DUF4338)/Transposase DNA-binding
MIGTIRIRGRWVSLELLERISKRSQGPETPSRQQLVKEFCRATGWRDAKGRLSVSSASVALRRLEAMGKVKLPPMAPRVKGPCTRSLQDDGQPLPELPKLRAQGGRISGLRMRLVRDHLDPAHRIWNRLIVREHPLGRSPLVGAQLRYLVECDQGVLGAFGFGPPAYHMECRDQWIGWNATALLQNRRKVLGLSRFLIRPGLGRIPNLASQCYGLVLRQAPRDWLDRYGVKPVLVETYVDRLNHQGRSLSASNWRRVGESKGRGRDDRQKQKNKSIKDVWLYELEPKARVQLQEHHAEILAPRSVFAPMLAADWVEEEMSGLDLGDERLNQRARCVLSGRWARPASSFYRSFDNKAQGKGAYELVENPRAEINLASLLAPHQLQTARRMAAEKVVLLAQDTTTLSYSTLKETQGLGPLGEEHGQGLFLHSLQAFRLDGIILGTAWAETWARPEHSDTAHRNQQSIDQKESGRWLRALQVGAERARQMPQTKVIVCGDRESDIYELYDQTTAAPENLYVLVRSQHDRRLSDGTQLRETLAAEPSEVTIEVHVPRRQGRPARKAILEIRWKKVRIEPPAVALKKSWPALDIYAVWAREVGAPDQTEPIDWLVLSTWPVETFKMACRLVKWYALRWGIEVWHGVLKAVCGVEKRQMKSAKALERALAFDMIVACRVLLLNRLAKEHPDLPAELFYSPEELAVLDIKKKRQANIPTLLD